MNWPEWFKFLFFTLVMMFMAFVVWVISRILTIAQQISVKENTLQAGINQIESEIPSNSGGGLSIGGIINVGKQVLSFLGL